MKIIKLTNGNISHYLLESIHTMRICFCMLFLAVQLHAGNSYSQNVVINLSLQNTTVGEVLDQIEKDTDFSFLFTDNTVDVKRKVDIDVNGKNIQDILAVLFKGTDVQFKIVDKQVILSNRKSVKANTLQSKKITGRIVDAKGEPIIGANVVEKGTMNGIVTDLDGKFALSVQDDAVLLVSYIGYMPQEIKIGNKKTFQIVLRENIQALEEIVVVGYGTQKKVNLTGAVDVITENMLTNRSAATVSQMIQGASPNLNISTVTLGGEPGARRNWNIRGIGTLEGTPNGQVNYSSPTDGPLVLVDGVEMAIDRIEPESIESISILKDASASAIYGSRAPFGVILVTTKRGKKNQPTTVSYNNNISFHSPLNLPSFVDVVTWMTAYNQACEYGGVAQVYPDEQVQRARDYMDGIYKYEYNPDNAHLITSVWQARWQGNANYNWPHIIMDRKTPHQKHNINVEGGGERMNFFVSAGYLDQPGLFIWGDDGYRRYNITANISAQATNWLTFNVNTKYSNAVTDRPDGIQGQDQSYFLHQVFSFGPMTARYLADGVTEIYVPENQLKHNGREVITNNDLNINIGAVIEPVKGWKTSINYNYLFGEGSTITDSRQIWVQVPNGTQGNVGAPSNISKEQLAKSSHVLINATSSYEHLFGKHYFRVLAGYEQEEDNYRMLFGSKADQITQAVPSISNGLGLETLNNAISHWAVQGYFGRLEYNFAEKYLIEFSGRYNGSSKFPKNSRWGFFPSGSVGYVISKEEFWTPIIPYVNMLKLRGSYGSVGNQNVANYMYLQNMVINRNGSNRGPSLYTIDGERPNYVNGAPGLVSADITWEKIRTLNVGVDAAFFNNRLTTTFEWYNRTTIDMLGPSEPYPGVLGAGAPRTNNAELETKGFEFMINWRDQVSKDFSYNIGFSLGDSKSKVLKYNTEQNFINGWYPGKNIGEFWGYETEGIMQTEAEVAEVYDPNGGSDQYQSFIYNGVWRVGDMKYKDLNGDGKINEGDRTVENPGDKKVIANTLPRYNFGITAGATWKDFDFNMFWQGIGKRDFVVSQNSVLYYGLIGGGSTGSESAIFKGSPTLDYWRAADDQTILGPNTDSFFGRPYFDNNQRYKNIQYQTKYVENAAYIRLKTIQLGYTVPTHLSKKIFIQKARVYVSGENLLTFTPLWKSIEPEAGVAGDGNYGSTRNGSIYPLTKSFAVGVNITF